MLIALIPKKNRKVGLLSQSNYVAFFSFMPTQFDYSRICYNDEIVWLLSNWAIQFEGQNPSHRIAICQPTVLNIYMTTRSPDGWQVDFSMSRETEVPNISIPPYLKSSIELSPPISSHFLPNVLSIPAGST